MQRNDDISALLRLIYEKERTSLKLPESRKSETLEMIGKLMKKE